MNRWIRLIRLHVELLEDFTMGFKDHYHHSSDEWMTMIQECRSSGLSDAAWCRMKGIPTSTFYSAVKRCRLKACVIPPVSFGHDVLQEVVPVTFSEPVSPCPITRSLPDVESFGTIQVVVNDYKIQLSDSCTKEAIKNILLAVREIC